MYNNSIMEEEIDIEEHDVLDNPRVKDMFPDLTKVKTEVLEEEDLVEPLEEDYIQVNDYIQYENDYEYREYNYYNDLDEDTEIENYSNKIILGSKPSTEEIQEETVKKEYLPAVVMLEDWGDRLRSSSCYCKDCKILFATDNALDYHKMAAHSFLVAITNKAVKSTARSSTNHPTEDIDQNNDETLIPEMSDGNVNVEKNKLCNHCNKYFPDGNTLIKHLYELLTKGDVENKKSTKVLNFKYQCAICQKMFLSYQGGKSHMSIVHPTVRANSHIRKIIGDSVNVSQHVTRPTRDITKIQTTIGGDDDMNYWYSTRMFIKNPPIPKSVLYKCLNCSVHFVMALPAVHHNRYCSENTKFLRCDICRRKMRCHDILLHKLQHKISNDFKIYPGSSRNYKKTLCKCPKCEVCYSETKFWLHYKGCSGEKLNCECCMSCGEFIHSHIATMHMNLHKLDNAVKNDFIIINFAKGVHVNPEESPETIVTTKKIISDSDLTPLKKTKSVTNTYVKKKRTFHLFYCKTCNSCMHINRWQHHLSNNCRKTTNMMCQQCGLMFTQKSMKKHKPLHDHYNVTVHDFEFFLRDGTRTTPKAPHFYQCSKCTVFFATKFHTKHHDCSEEYETCHVCSKKYNPHAFKLHMPFHKYDKTTKHIDPVITNKAQLVKNYSSLNKMWNILFLCESCGLNTDLYDEAVSHSQSHLQGSTDTIDTTEQALCKVCDLKFNLRCHKNHMQLHKRLPVNKKDFLILPYRYRALYKNQWFNLFGKLASKRVQQIISQSIYRDTRRVNMTLVKNGQTEYTVYVCKLCNACVKSQDVNKHVRLPCPSIDSQLYCLYCDIMFDTAENYKRHQTIHKKLDVEFRIVKFEPIASLKQTLESNTKVSPKGRFFIFYKCEYCKLSLLCKGAQVKMHVCYEGVQGTCKLCGLRYRPKYMQNHMRLHKKYPMLSRATVKCYEFRPKRGKTMDGLSKKYKQKSQTALDYKSDSDIRRKGIDGSKKITSKIYLIPCKACGFVFKSRRALSAHLRECNVTSNETFAKADECPDGRSHFTVYKCSKCSCHFLYWKSLKKHKLTCSSPSRSLHKCHVCGLKFSLRSLNTHVPRHHAGDEYTIKVFEPDSGETLVYTEHS